MTNLADVVLDYLWFLEFSDEEELDPDRAVKLLEDVSWKMQEVWTTDDKQALSEAAALRLNWLQTPDEHGFTPRGPLTDDQKALLESLAAGRFDGYLNFEDEEK